MEGEAWGGTRVTAGGHGSMDLGSCNNGRVWVWGEGHGEELGQQWVSVRAEIRA